MGIWVARALTFQNILMIGKWEKWRLFFINYNPWLLEEKWRTFWVGEKERMANFQLDLFIAPTLGLLETLVRLVLFGGLGLIFLPRKHLGVDF